jgi:ubiquinone/menaquinone biosynthesis C-methylase UbiE
MQELSVFTDRQLREREYYQLYAERFDMTQQIDFSPVISSSRRPWNSYWSVYHYAEDYFKHGFSMLDFGSGPGENALRFAKLGYNVEGFDICESNVLLSNQLFLKYSLGDQGRFQVGLAEALPYTDECFNFIAGIDILHHVDIVKAINECNRVLMKGGVAVFREPLEVPILDAIRNTWPLELIAPKKKSFDLHITEDERKLNKYDLQLIKKIFPKMIVRKYFLFARFDKFFRNGNDPHPSFLEKLDSFLIKMFPLLNNLGGVVILILKK